MEKFTLTVKISRQIIYLVILLVKTLLSRNFCQKSVRVNFRNFHTVRSQHSEEITEIYSHHLIFWQKFREFNAFTKEIIKEFV